MTQRFHYNPETGEVGTCKAQDQCPFGMALDDHPTTAAGARALYEVSMADSALPKPTSSKPYPVEGDKVIVSPSAAVEDNRNQAIAGKQALVVAFRGSSYDVQDEQGNIYNVHWSRVMPTKKPTKQEPKAKVALKPVSSPHSERKPYPVEGDDVLISLGASASDSRLKTIEGKTLRVKEFTGTYYQVEDDKGKSYQVHWNDVKFAPTA